MTTTLTIGGNAKQIDESLVPLYNNIATATPEQIAEMQKLFAPKVHKVRDGLRPFKGGDIFYQIGSDQIGGVGVLNGMWHNTRSENTAYKLGLLFHIQRNAELTIEKQLLTAKIQRSIDVNAWGAEVGKQGQPIYTPHYKAGGADYDNVSYPNYNERDFDLSPFKIKRDGIEAFVKSHREDLERLFAIEKELSVTLYKEN